MFRDIAKSLTSKVESCLSSDTHHRPAPGGGRRAGFPALSLICAVAGRRTASISVSPEWRMVRPGSRCASLLGRMTGTSRGVIYRRARHSRQRPDTIAWPIFSRRWPCRGDRRPERSLRFQSRCQIYRFTSDQYGAFYIVADRVRSGCEIRVIRTLNMV